jgi:biopolymer transport protein ExbB/TolQ
MGFFSSVGKIFSKAAKVIAPVAGVALAPVTGGASLAVTAATTAATTAASLYTSKKQSDAQKSAQRAQIAASSNAVQATGNQLTAAQLESEDKAKERQLQLHLADQQFQLEKKRLDLLTSGGDEKEIDRVPAAVKAAQQAEAKRANADLTKLAIIAVGAYIITR